MPLRHAGVGMAEVRGDYRKGGASLQEVRGIGVAQNVKTGWRIYSRASASLPKTTVLVCRPPLIAISAGKDKRSTGFAGYLYFEQGDAIVGEHDVSCSPPLLEPTLTVPALRSKSETLNATISPYRHPVRSAH
jgi:hypothetical protein